MQLVFPILPHTLPQKIPHTPRPSQQKLVNLQSKRTQTHPWSELSFPATLPHTQTPSASLFHKVVLACLPILLLQHFSRLLTKPKLISLHFEKWRRSAFSYCRNILLSLSSSFKSTTVFSTGSDWPQTNLVHSILLFFSSHQVFTTIQAKHTVPLWDICILIDWVKMEMSQSHVFQDDECFINDVSASALQ